MIRWWWSATNIDARLANVERWLDVFCQHLTVLEGTTTKMAQTLQDLDAALGAFESAQKAAIDEINAAVSDILKKVGPAVDTSAEVARIQAAQQSLQQAADAVKAEDT